MGSVPIGYGIAVTAMQMLDVYTTIANHGVARPPRLVAATIDADGKRHDEPLPAPHQVVSPATAEAVTGMLQKVVNRGDRRDADGRGRVLVARAELPARGAYVPVRVCLNPKNHVADTVENRPRERVRAYLRFRLTGDLSIPRACGAQWLLVDRERLGFEPRLTPVYRDARWILYRL